ncbi:MAG: hypothetical protein JOZ41_15665, partial [Chloroflexi bacterium]|nr:hypothetical protein [Chloroflexota bacterium]
MVRRQDATSPVRAELSDRVGTSFTFLENGAIFAIAHRGILVNLLLGNPLDGGVVNLYLRRHDGTHLSSFPVIGPRSGSDFRVGDQSASWEGTRDGLSYRCTLRLAEDRTIWFWTIRVRNTTAEARTLDVVLTQDVGLALPAAVRTNELYTSQYIDHTVYGDPEVGYVICSRQNQPQDGQFPWIMQGCFPRATGYLTDGFQFFGLSYRETGVPAALTAPDFPNRTYQYELALPTLKSEMVRVPAGGETEVTFFAVYEGDHPEATDRQDLRRIETAEQTFARRQGLPAHSALSAPIPAVGNLFASAPLFPARPLPAEDLDRYFSPRRRHEEWHEGRLLSFFYGPGHHVVMKDKELLAERPHGHILRSGRHVSPDDTLSLTAWMDGAFSSHVAVGNTNFNKVLTISRDPLNVLRSSGQRIFVKTSTGYNLLGLPSAFEMSPNSARWIYRGEAWTIVVRVWTSMTDPAYFLDISVDGPEELEFLITYNLVVGDAEYETRPRVILDEERRRVELRPAPEEMLANRYPEARFFIVSKDADRIERVGGDGPLFDDGRDRG